MRKIYLFLAIISCSFNCKAQDINDKKYNELINSIGNYIDSSRNTKSFTYENGKYYNTTYINNYVYYLKFYNSDLDTNSYGFAMTNIINHADFDMISPQYMFNVGLNIILINLDSFRHQKWLEKTDYVPIDSLGRSIIYRQLRPKYMTVKVTVNGIDCLYHGLLYYFKNGSVTEKYYRYVKDLPPSILLSLFNPKGKVD